VKKTKVFDAKTGVEVLFEKENIIKMRTSDKNVININSYNGQMSTRSAQKKESNGS